MILLFDLSAEFWRAWHATAGQHVDAAFDRTVGRVVALSKRADRTIVCCDSGESFRKELDAGYKANRPAKEEAAVAQLRRTFARLRELGFELAFAPGYEADDVIATYVATLEGPITIAGSDKDLYALVDDRVKVYSLATDLTLGATEVKAKLGVRPDQVRDYLALVGDAADNVKGVPKIGAKTAAELLEKFGSLEELVKRADEIDKPAIKASLLASLGVLDLAVRLVTLRTDAPIKTSGAAGSPAEIASRPAEAPEGPGNGTGPKPEVQQQKQAEGARAASPPPTREAILEARAEEPASPGTSIADEVRAAQAAVEALPRKDLQVDEPHMFEPSVMKASPQIGELAAALAKAQGQIEHAAKGSVNPQFSKGAGGGRYADLASVWSACRAALSANGLAVIQSVRLVDREIPRHRLTTMLLHSSGQWLSSECGVLARDDSPQGFGSALTYARRYSLAALVGVAQDDDDAETAHGRGRAA